MPEPRVFDAHCEGNTLVVVPQISAASFAEEAVNSELDGLLSQIGQPDLKNVVFDFGHISYFGSSMLGAMHALWKRVSAGNGKMAVCNVSEVGREVLEISRFDTLWPIFASREEALRAVAESPD